MRILLAEDDTRLAEPLSEFLSREHHSVTWLSDGQQALDSLIDGGYQLALLDWMLPSRDGLSIVRDLRRRGDTTLVLMLTARDGLADMVEGLEAGADDYLVKPFRMGELAARIRSLERRRDRPYQASQLVWNALELDSQAGQLWCQGQAIALTSKELQLLEWFLRHPGQLFSRSQLLDRLWCLDASAGEETVKTHLNNLRRKLRSAGSIDPIETVHGLGYRLRNRQA
ncbi:MAG: response regulator transcription factor [Cyanobacteria bacterium]|nr:response regulator transcription factor [Cyanobacteriota bacterium]